MAYINNLLEQVLATTLPPDGPYTPTSFGPDEPAPPFPLLDPLSALSYLGTHNQSEWWFLPKEQEYLHYPSPRSYMDVEAGLSQSPTVPFPLLDPVGAWNAPKDISRFGNELGEGATLLAALFGRGVSPFTTKVGGAFVAPQLAGQLQDLLAYIFTGSRDVDFRQHPDSRDPWDQARYRRKRQELEEAQQFPKWRQ